VRLVLCPIPKDPVALSSEHLYLLTLLTQLFSGGAEHC
jgi:hypothetical protein